MPIEPRIKLTGFKELERYLRLLPQRAAQRLQAVVIANHLDHRKEILRSSGFSARGTRNLKFAIRIFPSPSKAGSAKRVKVKRIKDVEGGTSSFWRGIDTEDPAQGVARRLEKRIGTPFVRPTRKRFLLLPFGDFVTPTGRPRRERRDVGGRSVQAPILIRNLPGARIVRMPGGKLRVIQRLQPGQRGRFETGIKGVRGKRLGARERIVGILVRQARTVRGLDFFGSWDRLASAREARYSSLVDSMIRDK